MLAALACLAAGPVYANCSNPTGVEGNVLYNAGYHTYQFCNGTSWIAAGGASLTPSSFTQSGYFVMSKSKWTGNLGDLSGADALCLTELTTNTGWMGYATANGNSQLVAGNVHALLLSDDTWPAVVLSGATYYFANANNAAYGGASFTVDQYGNAPNDSANWSGSTYFGASYSYWTGPRSDANGTYWENATWTSGADCTNWSDALSSDKGDIGESAFTDGTRYGGYSGPNPSNACNVSTNLICYVNPLK